MAVIFNPLLALAGLLLVGSIALGLLFDRVATGRRRDLGTGIVCGVLAGFAIVSSVTLPTGYVIDARMPFLVIAGLLGGPLGALAVLPLPLAARIDAGGPVLLGCAGIVMAVLIGLCVRIACARCGLGLERRTVLMAAVATPLLQLTLLLPGPPIAEPLLFIVPLVIFNAAGTAGLGLASVSELARSDAARAARALRSFEQRTQFASPEVFDCQVRHHWTLHETFSTPHAMILASIDNAAELRTGLGDSGYENLRAEIGTIVGGQVREADLATARDFDRFALLLPQADSRVAREVGERVRSAVRALVMGPNGPVTLSIGLADTSESLRAGDVEAAAEGALYLANARQPIDAVGPPALEDMLNPMRRPGRLPCEIDPVPRVSERASLRDSLADWEIPHPVTHRNGPRPSMH